MNTDTPSPAPLDYALLAAIGLIWGSSFLLIKVAVTEMPPPVVAAIRITIAAAMLVVVLRLRGLRWPADRAFWRHVVVVGLLNNALPFTLIPWGEQHISSGLASILNAPVPVFTALLAVFIARQETLSGDKLIGVVVGFLGVIILVGPDLTDLGRSQTQGELAVLLAALCYATSTVYTRQHLRGYPALLITGGQLLAASAMTIALSLLTARGPLPFPSGQAIAAVFLLGVFCTGVALMLFFTLLGRTSATFTSMVTYTTPVTALLWGALLLHERLEWPMLAGLALISLSIALTNGTLRRALAR